MDISPGPDHETQSAQPPPKRSPTMILLSAVATFAFLIWLCWIGTRIILMGLPEEGRADVLNTVVMAGTGLVVSAALAARSADTSSPFGFIAALASAVRSTASRFRGGFY